MADASGQRRVVWGIGSNLGDRMAHLQSAVDSLGAQPRVRLTQISDVYETVPVGGPEQPYFLNAVVIGTSDLDPLDLLDLAQSAESAAERTHGVRWGPRTLDVDILLVSGVTCTDDRLTLPHPRVRERAFVLGPWADIDPDEVVADGLTVQALLDQVSVDGIRRTEHVLVMPT